MPDWALELIKIFGILGFVIVMAILIIWVITNAAARRMNAGTKQDETVTAFAINFNAERTRLQERYDKLSDELTQFRVEQAKKEGGLEVLEKMLTQERAERRGEREGFDEKFRKLDGRVQELEKNNQQGLDKIKELEAERDSLNSAIAEKDAQIGILKAENLEQKTKVEHLTNKANTLSELVERLQVVATPQVANTTQPIPEMRDVDDTFIPELTSAVTTAEEQKP